MKTENINVRLLTCIIALISLSGCEDAYDTAYMEGRMPLVVEGWIEEGEPPIVMVTRALDLNDEDVRLEDAVEKWCRVTVFDDGQPYVLTARRNTDYNPNFIFTSSRLKGKPGHTYRLLVETDDTVASAEARLVPSASISRLEALPVEDSDTLFSLRVYLDNVDTEAYYKLFCKGPTDRRHFPSFLGNLSGSLYDDAVGVSVSRGIHSAFLEDQYSFSHFFSSGEKVEVKLCSIDRPLYDFWNAYDLNVSLSSNIFLSFVSDCPGNVAGAKGYWAAYGSSLKVCRIPALASTLGQ